MTKNDKDGFISFVCFFFFFKCAHYTLGEGGGAIGPFEFVGAMPVLNATRVHALQLRWRNLAAIKSEQ